MNDDFGDSSPGAEFIEGQLQKQSDSCLKGFQYYQEHFTHVQVYQVLAQYTKHIDCDV
jgi:hypothetical protein